MPSFFDNNLELILFGGKGGVGKTTASVATALHLAKQNPEKKILIISTDPAHSLGDSFDQPIGREIVSIKNTKNLWGLEIDASKLMEEFKSTYRKSIEKILWHGTTLDYEDIDQFISLALPGVDEFMSVKKISDVLKENFYQLIIVDTAPTGHTIRLLSIPELMKTWARVMDLMLAKHRYLSRHWGGKYVKDHADAFIKMFEDDVRRVNMRLKNDKRSQFVPVTIPEPMSIYETEDLVARLKKLKIPVTDIVVNRVAEARSCAFCSLRNKDQKEHFTELEEKFASYNLIRMPLFPYEIQGQKSLFKYAEVLSGEKKTYKLESPAGESSAQELSTSQTLKDSDVTVELMGQVKISDLVGENLQFLLFGGKGGVGKTSCSAASAIKIARDNPDKKILIFSTDPAHSLADSFALPIGDKVTPIKGIDSAELRGNDGANGESNLFAIEIDSLKLLDEFKAIYKEDLEKVIDSFVGKSADIPFDRAAMTEMIEMTPPGMDEIMALEKIIALRNERKFDIFILDTAPTGHMLRLMEMPELVRDWMKTIFRVLIKNKALIPLTKAINLNKRLIALARGARLVREALVDPQKTKFIGVTIPEKMGVLEIEDMVPALKNLNIPCQHIVVNKLIPKINCDFCSIKREDQQARFQEIKEKFPEYTIVRTPLFSHQIRGIDNLTKLSKILYK